MLQDIVCTLGKLREVNRNRVNRNSMDKHHVASNFVDDQDGWNEVSYRYTKADNVYVPVEFRMQAEDNRQASEGLIDDQDLARAYFVEAVNIALHCYEQLLRLGVCREQARMILPQGVYTRFRWTCSLHGILHFLKLRDSSHAQWEIQQYAQAIRTIIAPKFPTVLEVF